MADLATAILIEPTNCKKMTAIWVGGGDYPNGGQEYNLMQDIIATNIVFQSEMPVWQIPLSVYKNFAVSLAELQVKVQPYGKLGNYLFQQLVDLNIKLSNDEPNFDWPHGEIWGLGDEAVVAALMQEEQRQELYEVRNAPLINTETMGYIQSSARPIRVYNKMDYRMTLEDLFAKLAIFAQNK